MFAFSAILSGLILNPYKMLTDPEQLYKPVLLFSFALTILCIEGQQYAKDIIVESPSSALPITTPLAQTLGGLFVGYGTHLAGGCELGHGVCGFGRGSSRSVYAFGVFLLTGICTTCWMTTKTSIIGNCTEGWLRTDIPASQNEALGLLLFFIMIVTTAFSFLVLPDPPLQKVPAAVFSGALFACGLAASQWILPSRLFGFFNVYGILHGNWDLNFVLAWSAAIMTSFVSYRYIPDDSTHVPKDQCLTKPICGTEFAIPANAKVDEDLLYGSALFGVGAGLSGLCPGSALYLAVAGDWRVIMYHWPAFIVGVHAAQLYKDSKAEKIKEQ